MNLKKITIKKKNKLIMIIKNLLNRKNKELKMNKKKNEYNFKCFKSLYNRKNKRKDN